MGSLWFAAICVAALHEKQANEKFSSRIILAFYVPACIGPSHFHQIMQTFRAVLSLRKSIFAKL
jgi:hypothetical protein